MAGWSQCAQSPTRYGLESATSRRTRFWWQIIGRVLSSLLHQSSYSDDLRNQYDRFFLQYVVPLLGPAAEELDRSHRVSLMCDDNTPVELCWVSKANGEMTVQYAIEPLSLDGRPASSIYSLSILEHLAIVGHAYGFDSSWSRICHNTMTYPSHLLSVDLQKKSQFFIGIDLARTGLGLKAYFLPEVRSKMTGIAPMKLVTSAVKELGLMVPWRRVTSYLKTLPREYNVTPVIVAVDCVEPSQNRFKVYVRTQATHLSAMCDMLTLGGQLQGSAINATLHTVQDIWHSLFGNISDDTPVTHHHSNIGPTGFLFYYEMTSSTSTPTSKIYIPAGRFCDNDAHVARVMAEYTGEGYYDDVQGMFSHRRLASRGGIHSHITCAAKKGGCQVSAYFNPEAFSQDI